jgi:adenylate cyclase class 2
METELKIEVPNLDPIRRRLEQLGATSNGAVDEDNVYFDHDDILRGRDESFRLRKDNAVRLTWKGPTDYRKGVLHREEIEIHVDDYDKTWAILEHLGFSATDRLAKHRETWKLSGQEVVLDELAFGRFVEIEGDATKIRELAHQLDLNPNNGISRSYRWIQAERRPGSSSTQPKPKNR